MGDDGGPTRWFSPKSETRASYDLVSRMFDDLMFPWETVGPWKWMYSIPRAAPRAMPDLISQFNGVLPAPLFPELRFNEEDKWMQICSY